ncbi:hypothetical protein DFH08DRAFT_822327 [Mycena albidolilacea]|uniref:Uncharacterized protein n=1 Tax=Mycena albidolilacea TaxID=1033008 RepID=A0AAD7EDC4_9AGAR|nr:hypothetical protein DFH08DRAFT_822327 [Mycena albidolilacea]
MRSKVPRPRISKMVFRSKTNAPFVILAPAHPSLPLAFGSKTAMWSKTISFISPAGPRRSGCWFRYQYGAGARTPHKNDNARSTGTGEIHLRMRLRQDECKCEYICGRSSRRRREEERAGKCTLEVEAEGACSCAWAARSHIHGGTALLLVEKEVSGEGIGTCWDDFFMKSRLTGTSPACVWALEADSPPAVSGKRAGTVEDLPSLPALDDFEDERSPYVLLDYDIGPERCHATLNSILPVVPPTYALRTARLLLRCMLIVRYCSTITPMVAYPTEEMEVDIVGDDMLRVPSSNDGSLQRDP